MPQLIPVLTKEEIHNMVVDMANRISKDYQGRSLVFVGVLKGAFIFLSDLVREMSIPVEVEFVRASSYKSDTTSSGKVELSHPVGPDIEGKEVLVVEDIIDTGLTLINIMNYLKTFHPASLRVATLLDKTERRTKNVPVDYACHCIDKGFLVGYGLDYAEKYRELPGLYTLNC